MTKLTKPALLIDGDILAYRAAAATDGRQYGINYTKDGQKITKFEKYKKEADKFAATLVEQGLQYTMTLEYEPEPFSHCVKVLENSIKSLETLVAVHCNGIGARHYYLSRGGSFREKINPLYKNNRANLRRPHHLEAIKDHMANKYGAVSFDGLYEADDMMAMMQDDNSIICSIDKDLLQVPGHHFNFVKNVYRIVEEEEGQRLLYQQLLTGDTADGIPGLKGVGPKTAEKLLANVSSPFMMYCVCLKEYLARMPLEPSDLGRMDEAFMTRVITVMDTNMNMLYLLRSKDDKWVEPKPPEDT